MLAIDSNYFNYFNSFNSPKSLFTFLSDLGQKWGMGDLMYYICRAFEEYRVSL